MNRDINVFRDIYEEQFAEKEIKPQVCVMARKGGCPFGQPLIFTILRDSQIYLQKHDLCSGKPQHQEALWHSIFFQFSY